MKNSIDTAQYSLIVRAYLSSLVVASDPTGGHLLDLKEANAASYLLIFNCHPSKQRMV